MDCIVYTEWYDNEIQRIESEYERGILTVEEYEEEMRHASECIESQERLAEEQRFYS